MYSSYTIFLERILKVDQNIDETVSRKLYTINLNNPDHPYAPPSLCSTTNRTDEIRNYAYLGAQSDFSDNLLLWAFHAQTDNDPRNAPWYFQALQDLAKGRKSENLETEVMLLKSKGAYTLDELNEAFAYMGLDPSSTDETLIIGVFNSRLIDSPRQEAEIREKTGLIGHALNSEAIQNATRKWIMNINQAYAKLGAPEGTESSFIISVFEVAVSKT